MTIRLWNATTGALLAILKGHTSGINAVTFSPDSQILASGAFNDEMRIWDGKTGVALGELDAFEESATSGSCEETAAGGIIGEKKDEAHSGEHQEGDASSGKIIKSFEYESTVASNEEAKGDSSIWEGGAISLISF